MNLVSRRKVGKAERSAKRKEGRDRNVARRGKEGRAHPNQLSKREEIKERRSLKKGIDSPMI